MDIEEILEKLVEYVDQKADRAARVFKKAKDDQEKKKFILDSFQEIREKMDSLAKPLNSDQNIPQIDQNPDQSQQLQLDQVKIILTNFLKSAGQQMKASEKEIADVVDIINQKKSIMHWSTNSLIIKLWNTILSSVGEFKRNYVSSQSEISQQLSVMDGKLDQIMDSIKEDVLLELQKISKVQEMALDKAHENHLDIHDLLAQARKIRFDTYNLSQCSIQLSALDIHIAPLRVLRNPLIITYVDLQHHQITSQQQIQNNPIQSQQQLSDYSNTQNDYLRLIQESNDIIDYQSTTIIQCQNGSILVGSDRSTKLYLYSNDLKEILVKDNKKTLYCGLAIGDSVYCGCDFALLVLDQTSLNIQQEIKISSYPFKLLQIDDYLIVGQSSGDLDIISIKQSSKVFNTKLKYRIIYDIVQLNSDEYAFACEKGLCFANINLHKNITFKENNYEYYFKDEIVLCIQSVQQHLLIVGVFMNKQFQVINRKSKQVIKQIGIDSGYQHDIIKILQYDDLTFPYLIFRDEAHIYIINGQTLDIIYKVKSQLKRSPRALLSLIQKFIDGKLYLYSLNVVDEQQTKIQKYEIDNLRLVNISQINHNS